MSVFRTTLQRLAPSIRNLTNSSVTVSFLRPDGTRVSVKTEPGKTLYDAVIDNNVDIDGFGACEGTLCCTTCHLIFKQADFEKIGPPSEEELDMLDLAYGLTDTSRLGCQVYLKKELDPLEVQVPASINDVRES
uniref:Adrenodoxin, mitochondrial n=1 Tax=Aceria tosichella TaxID=561515 RepID=A0A6G1SKX4_9ACAR